MGALLSGFVAAWVVVLVAGRYAARSSNAEAATAEMIISTYFIAPAVGIPVAIALSATSRRWSAALALPVRFKKNERRSRNSTQPAGKFRSMP